MEAETRRQEAGAVVSHLLTGRRVALDGRGVTDVLMVTTTVGMLHRVHRHTTDIGPAVALRLVLMVRVTSSEEGLLRTAAASALADHATARGQDHLAGAGGQLDTGRSGLEVVRHDERKVAGGARDGSAITLLGLKVAHDRSLRELAHGLDVADRQLRLLSGVDHLHRTHTRQLST